MASATGLRNISKLLQISKLLVYKTILQISKVESSKPAKVKVNLMLDKRKCIVHWAQWYLFTCFIRFSWLVKEWKQLWPVYFFRICTSSRWRWSVNSLANSFFQISYSYSMPLASWSPRESVWLGALVGWELLVSLLLFAFPSSSSRWVALTNMPAPWTCVYRSCQIDVQLLHMLVLYFYSHEPEAHQSVDSPSL